MAINKYQLGDLVRVTGTLTDADGAKVDADAVLFDYRHEAETKTTLTYGQHAALQRDEAGVYSADINVNKTGRWFYRFYSTGNGQAADAGEFDVASSAF